MSVSIVEKVGDVKIYGNGLLGGKGQGLVKINECNIARAHKLSTRILTTTFYDRYMDRGGKFDAEELAPIRSILEAMGTMPISVRSSATNEAWVTPGSPGSVHAGENASFMLPNNHPDFSVRFEQLVQAIGFIYKDFIDKQPEDSGEKMAVVINPIPGIYDQSDAGEIYYPLVSGVANSFFPYALKSQDPQEGFARIALGHGYATVLDDFPVISMVTIRNPIPLQLLGPGQSFFYAIDLTKNKGLRGEELETMKKLHVRFARSDYCQFLGMEKNYVTLEALIQQDRFDFRQGLIEIMETIARRIASHFQIEFVFNIMKADGGQLAGQFHVVQLTQLPAMKFETIEIPNGTENCYLSISNLQGHGIIPEIQYAVVVSPFLYSIEQHDRVRREMHELNRKLKAEQARYIIIAPGRLGTKNRQWGIQVEYSDVDGAVGLFEYGVDVAGRSEPLPEADDLTGGIYGSHFLYMLHGGHDEQQRRLQTRMYGTQGTHFLTNLVANNIIYGFIAPTQDYIDPWFFAGPEDGTPIYQLEFPTPVTLYADSMNQRCVILAGSGSGG
ncbi:MAG: hypothetical protein ONB31_13535 [candidate division KSB1 bacterium]|nr:hypothetical protein [candidate division KSB1 bacterium]MDZ7334970.1 hypothetical protein [candidate division KSB1 bacterium]MDZ7358645.1 hypothetical protein [candidate division KSB1 bacterium]MDZ7401743.1 hypothetical protein [candidate division KSB1 bacterium]